MTSRILYIPMFFLLVAGAFAQDDSEVFAPFVSQVSVKAETGRVLLSWKNSEDLAGYKKIYRSAVSINETTFKDAVIISRLAPEVESYIDVPPAGTDFFYAILLEDKAGELYQVFIPFRNVTTASVRLAEEKPESATPAQVTGIAAEAGAESITVRFAVSHASRELVFYRSISPIRNYDDLTRAVYSLELKPGTDRITDVPVSGVDYYYAVFDAALLESGKAEFVAGANITVAPAQIPLSVAVSSTERERTRANPLPAPHILYNLQTGERLLPPPPFLLPPETKLESGLQTRLDSLIERIKRPEPEMSFTLLPYDDSLQLDGEDKVLQSIVKEAGKSSFFKDSAQKLEEFVRRPQSEAITARARYYLGQLFYLHGQYREALVEFILAEQHFYTESQPWINAGLTRLGSSHLLKR